MINALNVSKKFEMYSNPSDRFWELLQSPRKRPSHQALSDVTLEVGRGETVGIVGPNGSGKSTLLQVIAGIIYPTSGSVEVNGRISALLELGAGFNPEFTGRENVYLNASIMGMSRREIDKRYADITDFAGIGTFVDSPVKTYSSGMYVRLAFATAINVDPDVIIIDEALAVGDVGFQQKCMMKLKQLQRTGKTILFVSHDTSAVKSLCDRAILMDHGRVVERGSPEMVVNKYLQLFYRDTLPASVDVESSRSTLIHLSGNDELTPTTSLQEIHSQFGSGRAMVRGIEMLDRQNRPVAGLDAGDPLAFKVSVEFLDTVNEPIIGMVIRDRLGNDITATNTLLEGFQLPSAEPGDIFTVRFKLNVPHLHKGHYSVSPAVADGTLSEHDMCDWVDGALTFEILNPHTVYGMMRFNAVIDFALRRQK